MPCRSCPADPVEIRTQTYVVHSRNLGDVVDLINEGCQRRARYLWQAIRLRPGLCRDTSPVLRQPASARERLRPPRRALSCASEASRNFASSKPEKKFTCTTPPFFATARSMSSVMLRGALIRARAEECDAITGALRRGDRVPERLVRHVRDIHHHAQAVHLEHHLLAEVGQPVVMLHLGIVDVAGRVRPFVGV